MDTFLKKNAWNFQKALKTKQQDFFLNFNKFCKYCQELPSEHLLISGSSSFSGDIKKKNPPKYLKDLTLILVSNIIVYFNIHQ